MRHWVRDSVAWFGRPFDRALQWWHCMAGWHAWQIDTDKSRHCRACGVVYPPR